MFKRKNIRLNQYDYGSPGSYFITICVKERKQILSNIIPAEDICQAPKIILTKYGKIVESAINNIPMNYSVISVDNYVIMPDHIHLLLRIHTDEKGLPIQAPTIDRVIKQFKSYVTKQLGLSIWQKSFNDHIVRGAEDYNNIWEYIDGNPIAPSP